MLNTSINQAAADAAIVLSMSTRELVDAFDENERSIAAGGRNQITEAARELLLEELNHRDQRAFWDWVVSEQDSPREYYFPTTY